MAAIIATTASLAAVLSATLLAATSLAVALLIAASLAAALLTAASLAAALLAAALLAALVAIPIAMMRPIVGRRMERPLYEPSSFGVEAERISPVTDDGLALAAWLVRPQQKPGMHGTRNAPSVSSEQSKPYAPSARNAPSVSSEQSKPYAPSVPSAPRATVIIVSGIENPSVTAFFGYSRMLAANGYASLLVEMRAHNGSEGDGVWLGMKEWLDVKACVGYICADAQLGALPIVAMGTSMGGAVVGVAAGELPRIDGVVSVSAYSSWADVFADMMVQKGVPRFFAALEKPFVNLYCGFRFGFGCLKYTASNGVLKLGGRPLLLMHSKGDTQVPYASFGRLLAKARAAGAAVDTFVRDGDHHFVCYAECFTQPERDEGFSDVLLGFLGKVSHFGQKADN